MRQLFELTLSWEESNFNRLIELKKIIFKTSRALIVNVSILASFVFYIIFKFANFGLKIINFILFSECILKNQIDQREKKRQKENRLEISLSRHVK